MKKILLALSALTMTAAPMAASAHPLYNRYGERVQHNHGNHYGHAQRYYRPRYEQPTSVWRGRDGRVYCRRSNGTVGLVIGGAVGAIVGREVDTRGERATGTILGGALGALIGRQLQRGQARCR